MTASSLLPSSSSSSSLLSSSSSADRLPIGLTCGCPAGIGLELLVQALAAIDDDALPAATPLRFFASAALLQQGARRAGIAVVRDRDDVVIGGRRVHCTVTDDDDVGRFTVAGHVDDAAVIAQRNSLLATIAAADRGELAAFVTAPVRKRALLVDGIAWPGQTELVHHTLRDDEGPSLMVFAGGPFVLGLHTVHIALKDVARTIVGIDDVDGIEGVVRSILRLAEAARTLQGVARPRVVVLGVNPHAGEGGLFGDEELRVVMPAIAHVAGLGLALDISGPVPADGFFADVARGRKATPQRRGEQALITADAVLAMHHDQGLAPYKLLVGGEGVNITWGLRVPRTSPDHGTADAIAGRGIGDPSSTIAAIAAAVLLARAHHR